MDESQGSYAEWKREQKEVYTLWFHLYYHNIVIYKKKYILGLHPHFLTELLKTWGFVIPNSWQRAIILIVLTIPYLSHKVYEWGDFWKSPEDGGWCQEEPAMWLEGRTI